MAEFWAYVLGLSLLLYVLLDGFDLGVGILYPFAPDARARDHMMQAISPVWDGNETWLIVAGATLFGAFPAAYAILVGAFHLPVIVMLCGLILRGVAFEFRGRAGERRWLWSASFAAGSYVAAFAQGTAVGAFVQELPVHDGRFVGSQFFWLTPYALLCGVGLVLGYALLGASWLVRKTEGDVRAFGYRTLPWIIGGLAAFLALAGIGVFALHLRIAAQWFERPYLFLFLAAGTAAAALLVWSSLRRRDAWPLPASMAMFCAAFATMVFAVLPYIVPFSVTIPQAAAPESTLRFLFWGAGVVVLPITLIYTAAVYVIFRGKLRITDGDGSVEGADSRRAHPTDPAGGGGATPARSPLGREVTQSAATTTSPVLGLAWLAVAVAVLLGRRP
ncbi:cytochrome d ubiquinol oxidase subunit II [Methylobacterium sp. GXS13]|uniref:cytochrome d ubiquinol oxidase subunit II n=1 Tax=Methylobacterium sp. GXS13 TaxID=1730094 RepID=UPI0009EA2507|nr:cytochrome d ubiquinol oxidase subunit II [Methylobacterium sp. GXS13]